MRIAFDAKRAFENDTGLGNYVRILTLSFFKDYPQHEYYLVAPKATNYYNVPDKDNIHIVTPQKGWHKLFSALWRSKLVVKELQEMKIDLYHGMSHEIPRGIEHSGIKTVVTMHDLIFERYPEQYKWLDVLIYRSKFKFACKYADKIITVSKQTKQDLIDIYDTRADKIVVCYPSCEKMYLEAVREEDKRAIKEKYNLPDKFYLSVGSIIERKNLLLICKAMYELNGRLDVPLVVIGRGGSYMRKVKKYIKSHGLKDRIIFLSEHAEAKSEGFRKSWDFPAIYQLSHGLIYPTIFEGFGLPVLEGLFSKVPVITSNISCMPETGGDAAYYIDPFNVESLAEAMVKVAKDDKLRAGMIERGIVHAGNFTQEKCAANVMRELETV
jgi:glycosyltransferase involved in cell wall biosynthesis